MPFPRPFRLVSAATVIMNLEMTVMKRKPSPTREGSSLGLPPPATGNRSNERGNRDMVQEVEVVREMEIGDHENDFTDSSFTTSRVQLRRKQEPYFTHIGTGVFKRRHSD